MTNGFEYITFILSSMFLVLSLEKMFSLFIKKTNIYEKYGFEKNMVLGLSILDLFGAITIWIKYTIVGCLGAITMFCLCLGSIIYNIKRKTYKESILAWFGMICSATILIEYVVIA